MNTKAHRPLEWLFAMMLYMLCMTMPGCYPATGMDDDVFFVDGKRQSPSESDIQLHPVTPNPLLHSGEIGWDCSKAHKVKINIYTVDWRRVTQLFDGAINAGSYTVTWDCNNLPSGVYYIVLEYESGTHVARAVVLHKY